MVTAHVGKEIKKNGVLLPYCLTKCGKYSINRFEIPPRFYLGSIMLDELYPLTTKHCGYCTKERSL